MKVNKLLFIWSLLWWLTLVPFQPIQLVLQIVFVRIEDAIANLNLAYLSYEIEPLRVVEGTPLSPRANPWIMLVIVLLTLFVVSKNPLRFRTTPWFLTVLRVVGILLTYGSVRSNLVAFPEPLPAIGMWFGTCIFLIPFWLLVPRRCEQPKTHQTSQSTPSVV